ncbi:co-chaperone protein daf-41 [Frankliniella occidentalis]|uniref:Co-chaperone protein daf-41 n=1 Tax=Frankliniella occidentalis TaxID=133901 RepID=A0A6J1RUF9_FRAOC|nr:co-chaperone protein daf-41 [Frankliniella occidentalis]
MSGEEVAVPPPVQWAQRANVVFATICVEDCKSPDLQIEADKIYFKGTGGAEKKKYEVTIPLFKEVDPEKCLKSVRDRNIELILKKKDDGPYWPSLLKDKKKVHWLKVDFNKWKDEDDSEDELGGMGGGGGGGGEDLEEMMRQMGGLGGGEDKPSFDDLEAGTDSDDEELPDLV